MFCSPDWSPYFSRANHHSNDCQQHCAWLVRETAGMLVSIPSQSLRSRPQSPLVSQSQPLQFRGNTNILTWRRAFNANYKAHNHYKLSLLWLRWSILWLVDSVELLNVTNVIGLFKCLITLSKMKQFMNQSHLRKL